MIAIIPLYVCLIMLSTTYGFVMNLSPSNVVVTNATEKPTTGSLCRFEFTMVNNADGSRSKTSNNTYKHENNGITTYTTTHKNEVTFKPFPLLTFEELQELDRKMKNVQH